MAQFSPPFHWEKPQEFPSRPFKCGYCGWNISCNQGYLRKDANSKIKGQICICHKCQGATYFDEDKQTPGPAFGEPVEHLPPEVESMYREACNCMQATAYTCCAMAARKLIMNVAAAQGAKSLPNFEKYVDWLETNGYVAPAAKPWVTHIRKKGNEAVHELPDTTEKDARDVMTFTDHLLRVIYEFPKKLVP